MPSRSIIVKRMGTIVNRIRAAINFLGSDNLRIITVVATALDFAVAFGKDMAISGLVETLVVGKERPGIEAEAFPRAANNFVKGVLAIEVEDAEVLRALFLADVFVGLDDVEIHPVFDCKNVKGYSGLSRPRRIMEDQYTGRRDLLHAPQ